MQKQLRVVFASAARGHLCIMQSRDSTQPHTLTSSSPSLPTKPLPHTQIPLTSLLPQPKSMVNNKISLDLWILMRSGMPLPSHSKFRRPQTKIMRSCSRSFKSKEKQHHHKHFCLSHLFLQAAAQNPSKIVVIHGARSSSALSSGPHIQISRELITCTPTPPIYEGDHCFTFASMLISVDSLSSRLRSILDGADDPHLSKPQSPLGKGDDDPSKNQAKAASAYNPKIVGIYMPPSVEYIISVFSILSCGEALLPIDPSWPRDRVLSIVTSANVALIITSRSSFGKGGNKDINEAGI